MTYGSPKSNPPPNLEGATWDGTFRDEEGPIVEYRGTYAIRSKDPRPVVGNKLTSLYHASAFCGAILESDAFLPARETGNTVLGGSTRYESVSFSGNLTAAAYTAICIADAVAIANGLVTLTNVLDRVKAIGIPLFAPNFNGFIQYWTIYAKLPRGVKESSYQDLYDSAATGEQDPQSVWEAYRAMLHSGCFTKTIPDPGFMISTPLSFKELDYKNIGVVRAQLEPATWISRSAYETDLPGAFTYIGINRDIHMPDNDEYRVYDTKNLQVKEHYDLQECIERVETTRWATFAKTCFAPLRANPYPSPKGEGPIQPYEHEYSLKRGEPIETGDVDNLYHATVSISGIAKYGFLPRVMLKDKQALGGGTSSAVSMTANKQLACIIAAHLRNIVDIAQGRIHLDDILEMIHQEGTYANTVKLWLLSGDLSRYENDTAELHLDQLREGFICASIYGGWKKVKDLPSGAFLHPSTYTWDNRDGELLFTGLYFKRLTMLDYRQLLIKLYNCFVTHLERCENPVFWGLDVKNFINVKPEDIGVVRAKLHGGVFYPKSDEYDFKKLKEAGKLVPGAFTYLASMDEYRVFDYKALEMLDVVDDCAPNIC